MKRNVYWKGWRKDVRRFIKTCTVCQTSKGETSKPAGLLQPLPIPTRSWVEITMDFIEGLPLSNGKNTILVVIDRLTKYGHFIDIKHPYTARDVAQHFINNVVKLHGIPRKITSDRDTIFTSVFWRELMRMQGSFLAMSSAYHPQTDGQSEVLNRTLETYLRCFTSANPKGWQRWLPWAEFWYNTSVHSATQLSPFEALYGVPPPALVHYIADTTAVAEVDAELKSRQQIMDLLKVNLAMARNRMKQQADKHRVEREFAVGDWVYLKLQPYRQGSAAVRTNQKLSPKFYGPYQVIQRVGQVAYTLKLPATTKVHPTFHVSQLKKHIGEEIPVTTELPEVRNASIPVEEPEAIIDRRIRKRFNRAVVEGLVTWKGRGSEAHTWEILEDLQKRFPDFDLEDKI